MGSITRAAAGVASVALLVWMLVLLLGRSSFRTDVSGAANYTASCSSIWSAGDEDDVVQLSGDHIFSSGVEVPDKVNPSDFDSVRLDQACNERRDSRLGLIAVLTVFTTLLAAVAMFGLQLPRRERARLGAGSRR